ncbi:MAG: hypothetical protein ACR2HN_00810 [Tepidiformaceae bacterium]
MESHGGPVTVEASPGGGCEVRDSPARAHLPADSHGFLISYGHGDNMCLHLRPAGRCEGILAIQRRWRVHPPVQGKIRPAAGERPPCADFRCTREG